LGSFDEITSKLIPYKYCFAFNLNKKLPKLISMIAKINELSVEILNEEGAFCTYKSCGPVKQ